MSAAVRPAEATDVSAVAALEQALFGADAWSAPAVAEELAGPDRDALVAVADGEVVGYAVTRAAGDVVDLQRIAVAGQWQRQGLARDLLRSLVATARGSDVRPDRMLLEVSAANAAALAFYAAEGFTEVDRRRRYYRDGTDAVVMRLAFDDMLRPACGGGSR
ncbi:MAG: ribosomal protein S18-alanine N-acetyltransferase [Nocardioidaceae bacterium]